MNIYYFRSDRINYDKITAAIVATVDHLIKGTARDFWPLESRHRQFVAKNRQQVLVAPS